MVSASPTIERKNNFQKPVAFFVIGPYNGSKAKTKNIFQNGEKTMIRRAQEKDLARVLALLQQVLTVHADGRPDIFAHGTTKYSDEELLALFQDDTRPIFVFTDKNDSVLGYAFCVIEEIKNVNNMHDRKMLYIDDICVDETCRGQHIATELYRHVRQYAKEIGCYHITLNVWTCNPNAKKFYDAMGMQPLKTVMEDIL